MSIFGAMTTAISGLNAQSSAFGNIGDDLANTQTNGYKGINTTFVNYITTSGPTSNGPDAVVAKPEYTNSVQGNISQSNNPLDLAISGQGFFPVQAQTGEVKGLPTFNDQKLYTRDGNFKLDRNGYLVNSTGNYLTGWPVDNTGTVDATRLVPLQVGQGGNAPVATTSASIAANLPATPASSAPSTTEMPVIDALGNQQNLELSWTKSTTASNTWSLSIAKPDGTAVGSATVQFGAASGQAVPEGTIGSVTATDGTSTSSGFGTGTKAQLNVSVDFGSGPQRLSLDLGTYGGTDGVTQFSGSAYKLVSLSQNGVIPGSYTGVTIRPNGDVVVNYDNGAQRTVAQVPIATFASPDQLQRQDGQAYLPTKASGTPRINQVGANGSGTLVTGALESSNVDIASEFTKLIVAQRAYSANTKMVTTADELLQQTIDMKR